VPNVRAPVRCSPMANWFTQSEPYGFSVERAVVADCDLSVLHIDGKWQWLVQRDGRSLGEGATCAAEDARTQAEIVALNSG
jgi:hypothetical protein